MGWDLAPICVPGSQKNILVQPRGEMSGELEDWFCSKFRRGLGCALCGFCWVPKLGMCWCFSSLISLRVGKLLPSQVPEGSVTDARFIHTLSLAGASDPSWFSVVSESLGESLHPQSQGGSVAEAWQDLAEHSSWELLPSLPGPCQAVRSCRENHTHLSPSQRKGFGG